MNPHLFTYAHLMLLTLLALFNAGCNRDFNDPPVEFEELFTDYDKKMSPEEWAAFKNRAINSLIQKYTAPSQLKRGEIEITDLTKSPRLSIPDKIQPAKLPNNKSIESTNFEKVDKFSQLKVKPEAIKGTQYKVPPNSIQSQTKTTTYLWPVSGKTRLVTKQNPQDGVKISAPSGTLVTSAEQGKVIFVGTIKGLGKVILIEHPQQMIAAYANITEIAVRIHQLVEKGQKLAELPTTPSKISDFHFELRKGIKRLSPLDYLPLK